MTDEGQRLPLIASLSRWCDVFLSTTAAVFTVLMVLIAGAQIIFRVLFNLPLSWSEEMATYLFIWWVYLGATIAVRTRGHLGIDLVAGRFPPRLARINLLFVHLCLLAFVAAMFFYGLKLLQSTWPDRTPITQIPFGLIFFIQPLCAVSMAVFIVEDLIEGIRPARPREGGDEGRDASDR